MRYGYLATMQSYISDLRVDGHGTARMISENKGSHDKQ